MLLSERRFAELITHTAFFVYDSLQESPQWIGRDTAVHGVRQFGPSDKAVRHVRPHCFSNTSALVPKCPDSSGQPNYFRNVLDPKCLVPVRETPLRFNTASTHSQ